jgi:hypothetical protein
LEGRRGSPMGIHSFMVRDGRESNLAGALRGIGVKG